MKKILIIEDEPLQLEMLKDAIVAEFDEIEVDTAQTTSEATPLIDENRYSVVISDLLLGDGSAADSIQDWQNKLGECKFIVYTVAPDAYPVGEATQSNLIVLDKMKPLDAELLHKLNEYLFC